MIYSNTELRSEEVARHYDELDRFYRELWGEHVHHGFWRTGRETPDQAVQQLVEAVAEQAAIEEGDRVCDVGSGYGATARQLVRQYGARVTALTLSPAQHAYATALDAGDNPQYRLGNWLDRPFRAGSFDSVIAIESTAHMDDKLGFFEEAFRVLRPGGRLVVCAWLAGEPLRVWERRHLLEPICREGRLPGMGSAAEYRAWIADAGLLLDAVQDLSQQVRRTWTLCMTRLARRLATDGRYLRYLMDGRQRNRQFAFTMLRIWMAYRTGAMQYGLFAAHKPLVEQKNGPQ